VGLFWRGSVQFATRVTSSGSAAVPSRSVKPFLSCRVMVAGVGSDPSHIEAVEASPRASPPLLFAPDALGAPARPPTWGREAFF
jgi:hypothetical protein